MNKQCVSLVALVLLFGVMPCFAEPVQQVKSGDAVSKKKVMTPDEYRAKQEAFSKLPEEEQKRIMAERREKMLMRTGGFVHDTRYQRGKILIANASSPESSKAYSDALIKLADYLKVTIEAKNVPGLDIKGIDKYRLDNNVDLLLLVHESECPTIMLVAPENGWACVNVKQLGDKNVEARLKKEVLRAFVNLCGAATSTFPNPMTHPIADVRSLDLIESTDMPIDVLERVQKYLSLLGVTPYEQRLYRDACIEGWASPPTNKYQQAVWNRTHEVPSAPITIEPGQKPATR